MVADLLSTYIRKKPLNQGLSMTDYDHPRPSMIAMAFSIFGGLAMAVFDSLWQSWASPQLVFGGLGLVFSWSLTVLGWSWASL